MTLIELKENLPDRFKLSYASHGSYIISTREPYYVQASVFVKGRKPCDTHLNMCKQVESVYFNATATKENKQEIKALCLLARISVKE